MDSNVGMWLLLTPSPFLNGVQYFWPLVSIFSVILSLSLCIRITADDPPRSKCQFHSKYKKKINDSVGAGGSVCFRPCLIKSGLA